MRAVILAAGYGTRMQRDVDADTTGRYRHLSGVPKPLLPVAGAPLASHWIAALEELGRLKEPVPVDEVVVVVNAANRARFERWRDGLATSFKVNLVCDGASSNESRPGAIACMALGVGDNTASDVLFIGGDTLFPAEFRLSEFLSAVHRELTADPRSCHVVSVPCPTEEVSRRGIIEIDETRRIVGFKEKPQPSETSSRLQCPCFYFIPAASLSHLTSYLAHHPSLAERDATGLLVADLAQRERVVAHPAPSRYDVGSLASYLQCCRELEAAEVGDGRPASS
ncbi:UTP--glucose-1-phosphate uridylyltransferase-like [Amphibalanus amphitrite]|uniref:UTP--glucose-1-phosphate uridylyltransferase-like n=1 Tax=Amphibalanus amphitrite TaxID=1232801 RepID=UPI001C917D20|nr:UTP--glucose-1-phosphate uridylyltransferase-like [Amphibalanus amphitrite]